MNSKEHFTESFRMLVNNAKTIQWKLFDDIYGIWLFNQMPHMNLSRVQILSQSKARQKLPMHLNQVVISSKSQMNPIFKYIY